MNYMANEEVAIVRSPYSISKSLFFPYLDKLTEMEVDIPEFAGDYIYSYQVQLPSTDNIYDKKSKAYFFLEHSSSIKLVGSPEVSFAGVLDLFEYIKKDTEETIRLRALPIDALPVEEIEINE